MKFQIGDIIQGIRVRHLIFLVQGIAESADGNKYTLVAPRSEYLKTVDAAFVDARFTIKINPNDILKDLL